MTGKVGKSPEPTSPSESLESSSSLAPLDDESVLAHRTELEEFFAEVEAMRPDLLLPVGLSEEDRKEALEHLKPSKIKTGFLASIPMKCKAAECIYAWKCPLQIKNQAPKGEACPFETAMVEQFFHAYSLELGVDMTSMVEVSMVREIVDQEIQTARKSNMLALEDFIVKNVVGVDASGNPIFRKELHPAVALEERLHKRKSELRKELLATREARAKHLQEHQKTQIADVLARYEAVKKRHEQNLTPIIDVEPISSSEDTS